MVNEGLRQRALGDDDVMALKLDVEVFDLLTRSACTMETPLTRSLASISMPPRVIQEVHGMVRRNPKIAPGHIVGERAGLDADRQDVLSAHDKAAEIAPPADPFDRPRLPDAVITWSPIARLNPFVAARRADQRAAAIAGDIRQRYIFIVAAAVIADLEPGAARFERRALRQAVERAADPIAAFVVDDGESRADARREAVDQRHIERCSAERDRTAALDHRLIVAARAAGARSGAADLFVECRSGIERQTRDSERAWIARREGAAAFDRDCARGAGAAQRTAALDRDRRACVAVNQQRAAGDCRAARIGVVAAEHERAGAGDDDLADARIATVRSREPVWSVMSPLIVVVSPAVWPVPNVTIVGLAVVPPSMKMPLPKPAPTEPPSVPAPPVAVPFDNVPPWMISAPPC